MHFIVVDVHVMASRIERCVSDVSDWCAAKRLQLNADKTEVLWFGPPSQFCQLSSVSSAMGALKMTDMKLQDMKLTDRVAGHEIAGHENGGPNSRT